MKKRNMFLLAAALLAAFALLFSCGGDTETFTVKFESNGGTAVPEQTINKGGLVKEPTAPTKTHFEFKGWFKEAETINGWTFDTDKVDGDITLYALWEQTEASPDNPHFEMTKMYEWGHTDSLRIAGANYDFDGTASLPLAQGNGNGNDYALLLYDDKIDPANGVFIQAVYADAPAGSIITIEFEAANDCWVWDKDEADPEVVGRFGGTEDDDPWPSLPNTINLGLSEATELVEDTATSKIGIIDIPIEDVKKVAAQNKPWDGAIMLTLWEPQVKITGIYFYSPVQVTP